MATATETRPREEDALREGCHIAGRYPQTVASAEAEAAMESTPNSMGYYRSRYDGKWYAKLYVRAEGVFSDGTPMVPGAKRYFEVEPIAWYPFLIGEGKTLLVSRHVLFTCVYDMESNVWSDSYLRRELQNFGLSCLDSKTKARIESLPLDNDCVGQQVCVQGRTFALAPETAPWCLQPVTWDGVFVLSRAEWQGVQTAEHPFRPTDYARAMGAEVMQGHGTGWLRTADGAEDRVATFGFDMGGQSAFAVDTGACITAELGVVPVVCVNNG